jgi:conjugal transfer pilus assembly protein TrbC
VDSRNLVIRLLCGLIFFLTSLNNVYANKENETFDINTFTPGLYVLVSFSMSDDALKEYFEDAENNNAKLIFRGLVSDGEKGSFVLTREKFKKLKINADINPPLFDEFKIDEVPVIIQITKDKIVKKISGHIPLKTAIEKFKIEL